jgi:hypothetical protein
MSDCVNILSLDGVYSLMQQRNQKVKKYCHRCKQTQQHTIQAVEEGERNSEGKQLLEHIMISY